MSARIGLRRDQHGASAVEFALVMPAFVVMLIGTFVFGYAMHNVSSLRLALEESGRALQLNPKLSESQLASMVASEMKHLGNPSIVVGLSDDTSVAGVKMARVSATYVFEISVPLLPAYKINYQTSVLVPLKAS